MADPPLADNYQISISQVIMDFNKTGIKNTLIKKYNIQPTAIIRLDGFYDANYKIFTFQRNYFFKILV